MRFRIFFIMCIAGAIYSRTMYCEAEKRVEQGFDDKKLCLSMAIALDIVTSMLALLILMVWGHII